MASEKLTIGRSPRGTATTSRPLGSFQRATFGSGSSAGTGGGGAVIRSLRFFQNVRSGLWASTTTFFGTPDPAAPVVTTATTGAALGGGGWCAQVDHRTASPVRPRLQNTPRFTSHLLWPAPRQGGACRPTLAARASTSRTSGSNPPGTSRRPASRPPP